MQETLNLNFIRDAGGPKLSDVFENEKYDLAVLQVESHADAFAIALKGRVDSNGEWEPIGSMNTEDRGIGSAMISADGIYEFNIAGIRQIRVRVLYVTNGGVSVSGVLWNTANNSKFPQSGVPGNPFSFGDTRLFVKGAAEVIFTDPATGAICGYQKTLAGAAIQSSVNLSEITGGIGNRLVGVIADTARITGTYTDEAFSMQTRALIMGGSIAFDAVSQTCEKVTASSSVLSVTKQPSPSPAQNPNDSNYWCYVREVGGKDNRGTNFGVDPQTWQVEGFTAKASSTYEITYFVHNASARSLPVPTEWNPVIMTVTVRFAVYRRQGAKDSQGSFHGWLSFIAPKAILTGNAGVNGSQTAVAESEGSWMALPNKRENMPSFCSCTDGTPIAYYVFAPCGDENAAVTDIVLPGGGVSIKAGQSVTLPLKFVMADGTMIQPDYSRINYVTADDSVATVDVNGVVTGKANGETTVTAYITKRNGESVSTIISVTVSGANAALHPNMAHVNFG